MRTCDAAKVSKVRALMLTVLIKQHTKCSLVALRATISPELRMRGSIPTVAFAALLLFLFGGVQVQHSTGALRAEAAMAGKVAYLIHDLR